MMAYIEMLVFTLALKPFFLYMQSTASRGRENLVNDATVSCNCLTRLINLLNVLHMFENGENKKSNFRYSFTARVHFMLYNPPQLNINIHDESLPESENCNKLATCLWLIWSDPSPWIENVIWKQWRQKNHPRISSKLQFIFLIFV